MPYNMVRLAIIGAVLLGIAAASVVHFTASQAYANGRVVEFDRQIAGPFEIALGKIPPSPIVGNLYLSILLTEVESKAPVLGAEVVVSATGPPIEGEASPMGDGPEIGPIVVNPDPDPQNYAGYYDTEQPIVLDRSGWWTFAVNVDSPDAGKASAQFLVNVTTPNPLIGIITLVALLAFIIVVALAIRMYLRERRRSKSS